MRLTVQSCVVAALTLVMAGSALAVPVTLPSLPAGPLRFKYTNYDMGVSYGAVGPVSGEAAMDALPQSIYPGQTLAAPIVPGATEQFYRYTDGHTFQYNRGTNTWYDGAVVLGVGAKPALLEDAWFVARVTDVYNNWQGGTRVWADGDAGVEFVIIGTRLHDVGLGSSGSILSDGYRMEVYAQKFGTFNRLLGSGGRTGLDTYSTINASNGGIDPVLVWGTASTPEANFGTPPVENFGVPPTYSHIAANSGRSDMYVNSVGGAAGGVYGDGSIANGEFIDSTFLDFYSTANVVADGHIKSSVVDYIPEGTADNWRFFSEDPLRVTLVVPEPLTMMGLFGAVGVLAGYMRKRVAAA